MILAIMQPYFFPYIGYWQLINYADCFVIFDDAQFIRHGWISRNRILKPGGGWQYILIPLQRHSQIETIKNVCVISDTSWKNKIIAQLAHYKKKACFFDETIQLVSQILSDISEINISQINYKIIIKMCIYLDISTKIIISSEQNFDYSKISSAGDWALRISEQMGADEYINPLSGKELFSPDEFSASNIKNTYLKPAEIVYNQRGVFEPSLSIIDVLMFNGIDGTKELLNRFFVE